MDRWGVILGPHHYHYFRQGPTGGRGGDEHISPYFPKDWRLLRIDVHHGQYIDALDVYSVNGGQVQQEHFGGSGGNFDPNSDFVELGPTEVLVGIEGTYHDLVNTLRFQVLDLATSSYRNVPPSNSPDAWIGNNPMETYLSYFCPDNIQIVALLLRSKSSIDALGVILDVITPSTSPG